MGFSRVGFDRRAQVATFRVTQATRAESKWLGPAVHYEVWAEKRMGRWDVVEIREVWRAGAPIGQPPIPPDSALGTPLPRAVTLPCRSRYLSVPHCQRIGP